MDKEYRTNSKRVMYLAALKKGYNTAYAIHKGAGYIQDVKNGKLGRKGTSAQEDAAEIVEAAYIDMKQCGLGYRTIDENGKLGKFVRFPHVTDEQIADAMKYVDVLIYMLAKTVDDALRLEALLIANPEKVENLRKKICEHMNDNLVLKRRIQSEARGYPTCELLMQQQHGPEYEVRDGCERTRRHYDFHMASMQFTKLTKSGRLIDGKHHFFHTKKADSEEHLKQRALEASELLERANKDLSKK
jgi:hypothetical protein